MFLWDRVGAAEDAGLKRWNVKTLPQKSLGLSKLWDKASARRVKKTENILNSNH